jgi:hypothetical protein
MASTSMKRAGNIMDIEANTIKIQLALRRLSGISSEGSEWYCQTSQNRPARAWAWVVISVICSSDELL